jgi:hypothetical protein
MQDDPDNLERSIDQVIDDVARGMTGAHVDEGFARRVSARLQDAETGPSRAWPRAWLLVPAAGVVLLAAFLVRDARDGNVRVTSSAKATAVRKPDATTGTASAQRAEDSGLSQDQSSALSPQPSVRPEPSLRRPQPLVRPALAADPGVEPLATPPIEFAALDVSPLVTVMPIEIQVIAIDRIEIPPMP